MSYDFLINLFLIYLEKTIRNAQAIGGKEFDIETDISLHDRWSYSADTHYTIDIPFISRVMGHSVYRMLIFFPENVLVGGVKQYISDQIIYAEDLPKDMEKELDKLPIKDIECTISNFKSRKVKDNLFLMQFAISVASFTECDPEIDI